VAAITRHALDGGFVLALCCDYRVASKAERAKFACSRRKRASPSAGDRQKLSDTNYPPQLLRRLALLEQAVIDELTEAKDVIALATARALEFSSFPAYREVKAQIKGPLAALVGRLASQGRGQLEAQY
jgi:enoyl-CoA hydratase